MTEPTAARGNTEPLEGRLAYHPPEVRDLGSMADLTAAGTGDIGYDGSGYSSSSSPGS
jgi:hypothetical protein